MNARQITRAIVEANALKTVQIAPRVAMRMVVVAQMVQSHRHAMTMQDVRDQGLAQQVLRRIRKVQHRTFMAAIRLDG